MKSRVDVVAVDNSTGFSDLVKIVTESGYSRIPVYKNTFDNVLGILYVKDLLSFSGNWNPDKGNLIDVHWHQLIRRPFFIPENKRINKLLIEFKEKKCILQLLLMNMVEPPVL